MPANKPSPIQDAIGALKLVPIVHYHPDLVSADAMLGAAREAVERLQALPDTLLELGAAYQAVAAVIAPGQTAYITPTTSAAKPFGAVVTDAAGQLIATAAATTIEGLAELIRLRLPVEREEVA